jgi:hypothetical protein
MHAGCGARINAADPQVLVAVLGHREDVGEHLRGVVLVGQAVPDRDAGDSARISTVSCATPRYSIPSKVRPKTRAGVLHRLLVPICDPEGSRYVTCAPWSCAATSKAVRVRVEVFSKISAMFLPARCCVSRSHRTSPTSGRPRV